MRKRFLNWGLLAILAVLSLALGGCGSQAVSGNSKGAAAFDAETLRADTPEAIDEELAARFERTKKAADKMFAEEDGHLVIRHKYGRTVLPERPQRIAVIGLEDTAVSLGIPIAAAHLSKNSYLYPLMKEEGIADIPINAETKTINLEAVQQVRPDLILMRDSYDRNAYNALAKIAPVVALDLQKEELTALAAARAVGQPERGEERLRAYYDVVKRARLAIKGQIGSATVAYLRVLQKEIRLYPYSANATNRFMYELLNLRPDPMAVQLDKAKNNLAISLESLPDLRADYLILSSGYGASSSGNSGAARRRCRPCARAICSKSMASSGMRTGSSPRNGPSRTSRTGWPRPMKSITISKGDPYIMELLTTGITFFQKGGIVMYALLLCSLFVGSIAIERALYFRRMDSGRAFAQDFYLALANGRWQ